MNPKHTSTILALVVFLCCSYATAQDEPAGKHLFIMSGQSNMAGLDADLTFIPAIVEEFGEDNVIVVKDAQGGQPIRRWCHDWQDSEGNSAESSGDLYDRLMAKVKPAVNGQNLESISFFWMQGERDAREGHGDVYETSLNKLVSQLKTDLEREDVNVIIGRLSDFDMDNRRYQHWTTVREAQVRFAEDYPSGAWINTDDLNDGLNQRGNEITNDLHMSVSGYKAMGYRFAMAGIALIKGTQFDPDAGSREDYLESGNEGTGSGVSTESDGEGR